jgi:hypothetical protein
MAFGGMFRTTKACQSLVRWLCRWQAEGGPNVAAGIGRAQRQQSNLLAPTMAKQLNRNDMDKRNNNGISRRTALKRMGMLMAGASCLG